MASPGQGPPSEAGTPRPDGQSEASTPAPNPAHLVSSPLFFQSSPAADGLGGVSSPLRQMSNSQSTLRQGMPPSSPLRQMTDSQDDSQRTPRASGMMMGGSWRPLDCWGNALFLEDANLL